MILEVRHVLEKHFLVELRGNVGDGLAGDESLSVDVGILESVLVRMLQRISSGCWKQMDVYKKHE